MATNFKFPSIPTIFCGIFLAYVAASIWNLIKLFHLPHCGNHKECFHSILKDNPSYQLLVYSSSKQHVQSLQDLSFLHQKSSFNYSEIQTFDMKVSVPLSTQKNGSMDLHLFVISNALKPKSLRDLVDDKRGVYSSIPLTQYEIPQAAAFQLLGESKKDSQMNTKDDKTKKLLKPVTHMRTKIDAHILTDDVSLPKDKIDYEVSRFLKVNSEGKYLPILHIDTLTLRQADLIEVKPDTNTVNLTLTYSPISFGKLRLGIQVEAALEHMKVLGFTSKDVDEIKGLFSGVNLYVLCGTFFVSAIHLMFDFLAFKNDISFWRGLDNMGGISPSTVAWRAFAQFVIFLYLLEEQTSMLVLAPNAIGSIIELWKVMKAFHVKINGFSIQFGRKLTQEESNTQALDSEGFKYLTYVIYPLCAVGAVYSLLYTPHKSWYSWVIQSLVNGVYAFGFLFMLPQLFINYKLKSVAHLPWRAFMYKAFNTFIDDVFAFMITMPTAHRVACFRDDIVFIIYLYQKWLYPVDKTRVNEYGQKGEDHSKKE